MSGLARHLLDQGIVLTRQQATVQPFAEFGDPVGVKVMKRPRMDATPAMDRH